MAQSNHKELSPQPVRKETRRDFPQELFKEDLKSKRPPTTTIMKPVAEIYAFFADFTNHPKFMKDIKSVQIKEGGLAHWVLEADGKVSQWDTQVIKMIPNEMIAWRSLEGDIKFVGAVTFEKAPGNRGTIVSLKIENDGLFAAFTEVMAKFVGKDADTQAYMNLRRLKAYLETGEVPTTEGQSTGVGKEEIAAQPLSTEKLH